MHFSPISLSATLRSWDDLTRVQQNHIVQISPPDDVLPEVARLLIKEEGLLNAAILYDDTISKLRMQQVSDFKKQITFYVLFFQEWKQSSETCC